jgi:hypothetical protein
MKNRNRSNKTKAMDAFAFSFDTKTKFGKAAKALLKDFIRPKDDPIPEGYVALDDHEGVAAAFEPIRAVVQRYCIDLTIH